MKQRLFKLWLLLAMTIVGTNSIWATDGNLAGSGTSSDPYQIANAANLVKFRNIVNGTNGETQNTSACAKLIDDIDLSSVCHAADDANGTELLNWVPIGDYKTNTRNVFSGTFDGDGHTISNLYIYYT